MHAQSQHSHKAETRQSTQSSHAAQQRDKKAGLRGLSFAEGEKALSPNDEQTPDDPAQWKRGVPPEIEALGLKHVKVECSTEAWLALSEDEKEGVLTYLVKKEAECESDPDLKRARVEIGMGRRIKTTEEKALAEQTAEASANQQRLRNGEGPMGTSKTIGIKEGETEVKQVMTTRTTDEPIMAAKEMEDHFDAAGSTFDSADYEPEDMQQKGVYELLEQAAQKILEYLELDPKAQVTVTVLASESHVTNPAQFSTPGSLAEARAANGEKLARGYFASAGIPLDNVTITPRSLGANGPAWDPKAGISKHDPMYTEHQFVRLSLSATVMVDTGEKLQVTEPIPVETPVGDAQTIKMLVTEKRRRRIEFDRGNSFSPDKNHKAVSDAPRKQRKNNAADCGP